MENVIWKEPRISFADKKLDLLEQMMILKNIEYLNYRKQRDFMMKLIK